MPSPSGRISNAVSDHHVRQHEQQVGGRRAAGAGIAAHDPRRRCCGDVTRHGRHAPRDRTDARPRRRSTAPPGRRSAARCRRARRKRRWSRRRDRIDQGAVAEPLQHVDHRRDATARQHVFGSHAQGQCLARRQAARRNRGGDLAAVAQPHDGAAGVLARRRDRQEIHRRRADEGGDESRARPADRPRSACRPARCAPGSSPRCASPSSSLPPGRG